MMRGTDRSPLDRLPASLKAGVRSRLSTFYNAARCNAAQDADGKLLIMPQAGQGAKVELLQKINSTILHAWCYTLGRAVGWSNTAA